MKQENMEKFINYSTYVTAGIVMILSVCVIIEVIMKNKQLRAIIVLSALYFVAGTAELTYVYIAKKKVNIIIIPC